MKFQRDVERHAYNTRWRHDVKAAVGSGLLPLSYKHGWLVLQLDQGQIIRLRRTLHWPYRPPVVEAFPPIVHRMFSIQGVCCPNLVNMDWSPMRRLVSTMMQVSMHLSGEMTDMNHQDSKRDGFILDEIPLLRSLARLCLEYAM